MFFGQSELQESCIHNTTFFTSTFPSLIDQSPFLDDYTQLNNHVKLRNMPPKHKDGDVVVALSGKWVSWTHTVVAYSAFLGALVTGLYLHYHKIVQNEYYVGLRSAIDVLHVT